MLMLGSCTSKSPEQALEPPTDSVEIRGVSVWDRISTRSEPRRSSERMTLLSLGEQFTYLDSSAIDSAYNNTRFLKVRLSDSTIVWTYEFASVLEAKPAVMLSSVPRYLRPDLLTISEPEYHAMDIVAVVEEWDDWVKVVNEKKAHVGWVKKNVVSYDPIDLAFALVAKRKLEEEDPEERIEKLEELLANNPYPNTSFLPEVRKRLEEERELLRESREDNDRDRRDRRDRD
jgi:hypothetical protein